MNGTAPVLLCADLDGTLVPNGQHPESPQARALLRGLARHPAFSLAYVSGRDLQRLRQAVAHYALPEPDFAIGDVGTSLYEVWDGHWHACGHWRAQLGEDWLGRTAPELHPLLADLPGLRKQEPGKQQRFKLSYYSATDGDPGQLLNRVRERLAGAGLRASLVWSLEETTGRGLLDVLPARADKRQAIEYLMHNRGFPSEHTVYAGNSGNDMSVLTSGLHSVLVANAPPEVARSALQTLRERGWADRLYLARGGLLGMNGNYAAGVLEGLAHFLPHTLDWLEPPAP